MNKIVFVLLCIVALAVSFGGCLYLLSPQTFSILVEAASTKITQITNIWNTLPDVAKLLIPSAISTGFIAFFAWTKSRAMTQLQRTQQEASQTITQLQGQANEQLTEKDATIQALQGQVDTLKNASPDNTALLEAQGLVTKLQGEVNSYKTQIEALNHAIAELKMKTVTIPK